MTVGFDEQKEIYEEFVNLKSKSELLEFLNQRPFKHDIISHYTSNNSAKSILTTHSMWFTKSTELNDKVEGLSENVKDRDKTYIASFSHELTENLEQWVLYGDKGYGSRIININGAWLKGLCRSNTIKVVDDNRVLDNSTAIVAYDVVYYEETGKDCSTITIYYDDCKNVMFDKQEFIALQNEKPFMFKPAIWKYEHETRLVLVLDEIIDNKNISVGFEKSIILKKVLGPLLTDYIEDGIYSEYNGIIDRLL